jgi:hypothetical protein
MSVNGDLKLGAEAARPAFQLMWAHLRVPNARGVLRATVLSAATGAGLRLGPTGAALDRTGAPTPLRLAYESKGTPFRAQIVGEGGWVLTLGAAAVVTVQLVDRRAADAVTFHPAPSAHAGAHPAVAARREQMQSGARFAGTFYLRLQTSGRFLQQKGDAAAPTWHEATSVLPEDAASMTELQGVSKWEVFI